MRDAEQKVTFTHDIRIGWGDCDPANIVYTARIPWFALDAIDAWWSDKLGNCGWFHINLDRNLGTPFVSMNLEFRAPVTPRHRLVCEVWPEKLGNSSITFRVDGRQDGTLCFEGRFVCVFVISDQMKSRTPPDDIREIVLAHLPQPQA